MAENVTIAVILSVLALASAWIIGVIASNIRRSRTAKQLVTLHSKLLDRFSVNSELLAYLEGSAGKRFFESLTLDANEQMIRIVNSIQAGIVLFLLGASFLYLHATQAGGLLGGETWIRHVLLLAGLPVAVVGVGLLVSSYASFLICRKWGAIRDHNREPQS
ncbi:MAG: hypothetical protein EXQ52_12225 [Bryobacterales bacterium]|nr:hypothetical protein [Bryobacterales bacterium]